MTETRERGLQQAEQRPGYTAGRPAVPMRDYERLKTLSPHHHHLHFSPSTFLFFSPRFPFLFLFFFDSAFLPSPLRNLWAPRRGTNHGNCSVEPTGQPTLAFAFLLGARFRGIHSTSYLSFHRSYPSTLLLYYHFILHLPPIEDHIVRVT